MTIHDKVQKSMLEDQKTAIMKFVNNQDDDRKIKAKDTLKKVCSRLNEYKNRVKIVDA